MIVSGNQAVLVLNRHYQPIHVTNARRAFSLDEVAIVPSRRTRDPECVELTWEIDAFSFGLPLLAAPMDSVVSPASAAEIARLGGVAVLHLEGLWTRYEDPETLLQELADLPADKATARMHEIYAEPVKPDLVGHRIVEPFEASARALGILFFRGSRRPDEIGEEDGGQLSLGALVRHGRSLAQEEA